MDLLNNLTDDQLALLGCFAALFVSSVVMALSYYVGPASKTVRIPRTLPHVERIKRSSNDDQRKAA